MASRRERILILCKTYPSPSGKHSETSCVAGITAGGQLIRLFPVPFRLIRDEQQFKKWQWISAQIYRANDDKRPESHKIYVDTISVEGNPLPTANKWAARRLALSPITVFDDFTKVEESRLIEGSTLALLRPTRVTSLEITPVDDPNWTDQELEKLVKHQQQAGLFESDDAGSIKTLRKLPYAFHYNYECEAAGELRRYRHKIADWEVGALYWNCFRDHGPNWEGPFRMQLAEKLPAFDLQFLMGTIHRFPDQWMIVSLIYPPAIPDTKPPQHELLL